MLHVPGSRQTTTPGIASPQAPVTAGFDAAFPGMNESGALSAKSKVTDDTTDDPFGAAPAFDPFDSGNAVNSVGAMPTQGFRYSANATASSESLGRFMAPSPVRRPFDQGRRNRLWLVLGGSGLLITLFVSVLAHMFIGGGDRDIVAAKNNEKNGVNQGHAIEGIPAGEALKYQVEGKNYRQWIDQYLAAKDRKDKDQIEIARVGLYKIVKEMPEDASIVDEMLKYDTGDRSKLEHVVYAAGMFLDRMIKRSPAEVTKRINELEPAITNRGQCLSMLKRSGPDALLASDYLYGLLEDDRKAYLDFFEFLTKLGPEGAQFFTKLFDDENLAEPSLSFLGRMEHDAVATLPAVLENWDSYSSSTKITAIRTMALIAPGNELAIQQTASFCAITVDGKSTAAETDKTRWDRGYAIGAVVFALKRHGNAATGKFVELCKDPEVLKEAISEIRGSEYDKDVYPEVWPIVKLGLESNDPEVVANACQAVRRLDDNIKEVLPQLAALLNSTDPNVKTYANLTYFENVDTKSMSEDVLVETLVTRSSSPEVFREVSAELQKRGDKVKPFLPKITASAAFIRSQAESEIEKNKGWFHAVFRNRDGSPNIARVRKTTGGEMRVPGELETRMAISGYNLDSIEAIDPSFQEELIGQADRLDALVEKLK
jgi:hypothetical protein